MNEQRKIPPIDRSILWDLSVADLMDSATQSPLWYQVENNIWLTIMPVGMNVINPCFSEAIKHACI